MRRGLSIQLRLRAPRHRRRAPRAALLRRPGGADQRRRSATTPSSDALQLARRIATRVDDHVNTVDALLVSLTRSVRLDAGGVIAQRLAPRLGEPRPRHPLPQPVRRHRATGRVRRTLQRRRRARDALLRSATAATSARRSRSRGLGIGEPMIGRMSHQYSIALGRAILGRDGEPIGVVAASTLLDQLRDILIPNDLPAGAVVTLTDADGIVLARTEDADAWIGHDISALASVRDARARREGVMQMTGADSVTRLAGFATASRVPWRVFVRHPERRRARARARAGAQRPPPRRGVVRAQPPPRVAARARHRRPGARAHRRRRRLRRRATCRTAPPSRPTESSARSRSPSIAWPTRSSGGAASSSRARNAIAALFDTMPLPMWVVDRTRCASSP